jgi:serine O-acetyltransferase
MTESSSDFYSRFRWHVRYRTPWRLAMWLRRLGVPVLPSLLGRVIRLIYGLEVPPWDREPEGLVLMHNGMGTVIHPGTRIEDGPAIIFHGVTIGNTWNPSAPGEPTLLPPFIVGAGAVIVGPITVGPDVIIGANAVVTSDVPTGTVVKAGIDKTTRRNLDVRHVILHDSRAAGSNDVVGPS